MRPIVSEVVSGVHEILLRGWVGRALGYDVRAYVIDGVLIDTGFPGVRAELLSTAALLGVRGVVITHWHEDHAGNAAVLARMGLPLAMHVDCEATLRRRPAIRLYRRAVWGRSPRLVGPIVPFDAMPLELVATPGHSSDHQAVWDAERRIVAAGDLFLGVKVRVAHAHESPRALLATLRAIIALEPRLLLDAHRGVVRNATELLRAKLAWMEATIEAITTLAAAGCGEREIQRRVLGREALVGILSRGEYSKRSLVRVVLQEFGSA